jgi:3',5'-nucleoside bisphosphate phosphatase
VHPDHEKGERLVLAGLADRLGLAVTGGSDDHGELTGDRIGSEFTNETNFERLLSGATGAAVLTK